MGGYSKTADPVAMKWITEAMDLEVNGAVALPFTSKEHLKAFKHKLYTALHIVKEGDIAGATALVLSEKFDAGIYYIVIKKTNLGPMKALIIQPDGKVSHKSLDDEQRQRRMRLMVEDGATLGEITSQFADLTEDEKTQIEERIKETDNKNILPSG